MTLEDYEKRGDIINPYITIFSYPDGKYWVSMNTSTFGDEGQENLLNIFDEKAFRELTPWEGGWFKVCAVVGKQNYWHDYSAKERMPRNVRADGADDPVAIIPLGYLPEEFIRKNYPKTYEYFKNGGKKPSKLEETLEEKQAREDREQEERDRENAIDTPDKDEDGFDLYNDKVPF